MADRDDAKRKKTDILKATTRLLASRGLQDLSFDNVAKEAGLSRQLVRYYYSDIEALMVDLADHLANVYRETLVSGIVDLGQVERLNFFLDFFFDLSDVHDMPIDLEVYDALIAYSVGSEPVNQRMCLQYQTLGQVVAHELAIAHPELNGQACEELSFLFVSAMHAHWSFVASLGYSRQHSRLARQAFDRLVASYIERPNAEPVLEKPWQRD